MPDSSESSDHEFVVATYLRLLGRRPDRAGAAFFLGALAHGATRAFIVDTIAESDEAISRTISGDPDKQVVADDRNSRYDDLTRLIIRRVLGPNSIAVDVGAHVGDVLDDIVASAPYGAHLAFEPIPELAATVRARFPGVAVHEIALSDRAGASTFQYVTTNPAYSGLRRRRYDRPDEVVREISVQTVTLDEIAGDLPIDLIKIDVEGAELQVLAGSMRVLARRKPVVVFEHGLGGADHYGTGPRDVWALISSCGLTISLLDRWLVNGTALTEDAFVGQFETNENYYFVAHPANS